MPAQFVDIGIFSNYNFLNIRFFHSLGRIYIDMKKFKKILKKFVLLYLIYFAVCCIVPPLSHQQAEPQTVPMSGASAERVLCIDDNTQALCRRLQLIEHAEEELLFSCFRFKDDDSGRDIMAALLNAADRGVKVRMVVDGISGFLHLHNSRYFHTLAASPNVEVRIYNPVNLLTPWTLNYRMHDKYIVADNTAYMLGGRNTQNLSLGNYQEKPDIDRDVLVYSPEPDSGTSLTQLRNYFECIWELPTTKPLTSQTKANDPTAEALRQRYQQLQTTYPQAFSPMDWEHETIATNGITLLTNPIEAENKAPTLWASLIELMKSSEKSTVQTPYIICSDQMYEDLTRLDGHVEIILNSKETGANLWGCTDYMNQKDDLRSTGVTLYEYLGERSSHTKSVLIDDNLSIIGSFNFDMRSAYLDTETMLVIDCPELNAQLRQMAQNDIAHSRQVLPDGTENAGSAYQAHELSIVKRVLYPVLRVLVPPFRHLF